MIAGSPRREASELQALVMERRQLLARQQTPRMREARAGARLSMRLVQEAAARPTETKFLDAVAAEAAAAEESSVPTGGETTTPTAFGRAESPSLSPPRGPSSSAPTAARARAPAASEPTDAESFDGATLQLQLLAREAELGRTRLAAERTSRLADNLQEEARQLQEAHDARAPSTARRRARRPSGSRRRSSGSRASSL